MLFPYGLSAVAFVACMALQAALTASPIDLITSVVLLMFGVVCFVPLAFFVRGAAQHHRPAAIPIADAHG
ncbi:MAG: hypothetical protein HC828_02780 [Blastochloris sp.]|nr:hypothetical protein [Blastochloris sp.]